MFRKWKKIGRLHSEDMGGCPNMRASSSRAILPFLLAYDIGMLAVAVHLALVEMINEGPSQQQLRLD